MDRTGSTDNLTRGSDALNFLANFISLTGVLGLAGGSLHVHGQYSMVEFDESTYMEGSFFFFASLGGCVEDTYELFIYVYKNWHTLTRGQLDKSLMKHVCCKLSSFSQLSYQKKLLL